jgi:hypothetical protein
LINRFGQLNESRIQDDGDFCGIATGHSVALALVEAVGVGSMSAAGEENVFFRSGQEVGS